MPRRPAGHTLQGTPGPSLSRLRGPSTMISVPAHTYPARARRPPSQLRAWPKSRALNFLEPLCLQGGVSTAAIPLHKDRETHTLRTFASGDGSFFPCKIGLLISSSLDVVKISCGGMLLPISALFWDVGGVLLTNAWDHSQRERALEQFKLDQQEFRDRHEMVVSSLERGKISFDEYLDRTIFYRPRPFPREVFKDYVFSLSKPNRAVLTLAEELAKSGKYFMGTINNESQELNHYRIQTFGLREFSASSSVPASSGFASRKRPSTGMALEDYAEITGRLLLHRRPRPEPGACAANRNAYHRNAGRRAVAAGFAKAGSAGMNL